MLGQIRCCVHRRHRRDDGANGSRRAVDDVNPDTGKEEPAPDGKAGPAAPDPATAPADKPANG